MTGILCGNCNSFRLLLIATIFLAACGRVQEKAGFSSPGGTICIEFSDHDEFEDQSSGLRMEVFRVEDEHRSLIIPAIDLNLAINDSIVAFPSSGELNWESEIVTIHYTMVHGKQLLVSKNALSITAGIIDNPTTKVILNMMLADDGVALKYIVEGEGITLIEDRAAYHIPPGYQRWIQEYQLSYEDFYDDASKRVQSYWAYPALFHTADTSMYVLISESDVTPNNYATRLQNIDSINVFRTTTPEIHEMYTEADIQTGLASPWHSTWKVLAIGDLDDIFQSTLVTDYARPSKLKSTEWIEPGKVSWVYWANNHGSRDFSIVKNYVDLAAEMSWPYVLIDWEWDEMGNGGNIEDAFRYAISKGVKVLLWYNSGSSWLVPTPVDRLITAQNRDKEFQWLQKMGVSGIKVDFFAGDIQPMMKYYEDILIDAARYNLLVNFHGSTIPRGWQRTYPHMMTMEAVYGAEWYNNDSLMTDMAAWHNTVLPFTRNVIGPMDYTPVAFTHSQHPHKTSYAHELALPIVFESGLQHFADRPEGFMALDEKARAFLQTVPVAWDTSRLLSGYPGEHLVVCRRAGQTWYIAGLNGTDEPMEIKIDLGFLNEDFNYTFFTDGATNEVISIQNYDHSEIIINCLPMGGFVGYTTSKSD